MTGCSWESRRNMYIHLPSRCLSIQPTDRHPSSDHHHRGRLLNYSKSLDVHSSIKHEYCIRNTYRIGRFSSLRNLLSGRREYTNCSRHLLLDGQFVFCTSCGCYSCTQLVTLLITVLPMKTARTTTICWAKGQNINSLEIIATTLPYRFFSAPPLDSLANNILMCICSLVFRHWRVRRSFDCGSVRGQCRMLQPSRTFLMQVQAWLRGWRRGIVLGHKRVRPRWLVRREHALHKYTRQLLMPVPRGIRGKSIRWVCGPRRMSPESKCLWTGSALHQPGWRLSLRLPAWFRWRRPDHRLLRLWRVQSKSMRTECTL